MREGHADGEEKGGGGREAGRRAARAGRRNDAARRGCALARGFGRAVLRGDVAHEREPLERRAC